MSWQHNPPMSPATLQRRLRRRRLLLLAAILGLLALLAILDQASGVGIGR